jgi:subtilisin-like proprotein convertase family protein
MTAYGGQGWCAYPWMIGIYETSGSLAIPDGDPAGVSMDVVVYGQASVPMDIVVTLQIDHPNPADLVVTLISTNGSDSVLWNHDSNPDYYLPANGIERDNYINGTLTLHVADTVAGNTGTLKGFKLLVSSRYD